MSKAEDLAEKVYPQGDVYIFGDASIACRIAYVKGYHQAEKDLELTWEDIREICRMWIESKTPFGLTGEALSIEVLKRFKEKKEESV